MEINKLTELVSSKLNSLGYDLVSLTYLRNTLAIVIDRVEPIEMNAISEVSEILSNYLDEIDPFSSSYTLDVSSLGAEKPLKVSTLASYVGSYVNVHVTNPIEGENIFEGTIESVSENSFVLEIRIKTRVKKLVILFNNIYKIRLAIKF